LFASCWAPWCQGLANLTLKPNRVCKSQVQTEKVEAVLKSLLEEAKVEEAEARIARVVDRSSQSVNMVVLLASRFLSMCLTQRFVLASRYLAVPTARLGFDIHLEAGFNVPHSSLAKSTLASTKWHVASLHVCLETFRVLSRGRRCRHTSLTRTARKRCFVVLCGAC
jgi:hypothetical protein